MISLTPEQLSARRRERVELLAELNRLSGLRARLRTIDQEILSGCVTPAKGVRPEQLSLTDRADMEAAADEAVQHNRREDVRSAVLAALDAGAELTIAGLARELSMVFARTGRAATSETEVREVVATLVTSKVLQGRAHGEEAWYRLAPMVTEKKPRRGQQKAAAAPLAPPAPPKDLHPQVVLRGWLWKRLEQSSGLTTDQLAAELTAFDREAIEDTLNLLFSCNLVGDRNDKGAVIWWASDAGEGGAVDRLVLDAVLAAVRDEGPASDADVSEVLGVSEGLAACLLDELHEAKRIEPATRTSKGTPETWQVAKKKRASKGAQSEVTP